MPNVTIEPAAAALAASRQAFSSALLAHDVIGGKDEHACLRPPPAACQLRGDGDRHGGIAARRLQHNVGINIALAQLLGGDKTKIGMGDDDRSIK